MQAPPPPRASRVLLLLLLAVLVNLPLVHGWWQGERLARDGVEVVGRVTELRLTREPGDRQGWVSFRLPDELDRDGVEWPARLEPAAFAAARATRRVDVRVLAAEPGVHLVDGQHTGHGAVLLAGLGNLVLLLGVLTWRFGAPGRLSRG